MSSGFAALTGNALLVPGYAVAVVVLARFIPVLRERRSGWFFALELATAGLVAGHLLAGRVPAAVINAVALACFAAVWCWSGRRLRTFTEQSDRGTHPDSR